MTEAPEGRGPRPTRIAFLDTETLGLHPDLHAIWEVGLCLYDPATGATENHLWQIALHDHQIADGDPVGMKIGGFDERYDAASATDPDQFCSVFVALTEGLHLAGNVVSFDEERLRRMCLSHGVKPLWHYHLIDVENLAIGWLGAQGESFPLPWKSDDIADRLGVEVSDEDRHTALGDARWALRTFQAMFDPGAES